MSSAALQQQFDYDESEVAERSSVDDKWFSRSVAEYLGIDTQSGAERYARVNWELERFRSIEERSGDRDGLQVGLDGVQRRLKMRERDNRTPLTPQEAAARRRRVYNVDDFPQTNGLWRVIRIAMDHRGRLSVDAVCSGPFCSTKESAPRTRRFAAREWHIRQTSCSACATYRRRTERAAAAATEQERVARLLFEGCCIVCGKKNPTPKDKRCQDCRARNSNAHKARRRRRTTKRAIAVRYPGKDTTL